MIVGSFIENFYHKSKNLKYSIKQNSYYKNMTDAFQVPHDMLIDKLASTLKSNDSINPPDWVLYVKLGSAKERPPHSNDWWYTRCASLLRKLYVNGPLGLSVLEREYGDKKQIKFSKSHQRDSGQSAIRKPLHQLEQAGLVVKSSKGRMLSGSGHSLLDKTSSEIIRSLSSEIPALSKYT